MSTQTANRAAWEPMRSLAESSITTAYVAVGTPLTNPSRLMVIQNETDTAMTFSFDGVNDHLYLGAGVHIVLDYASDSSSQAMLELPKATQVYVKYVTNPTTGAVYVSTVYGRTISLPIPPYLP